MKRFITGTFYYGFSSIIGRAIGFIMLPIYTSKLTPADYGVIAFLLLYVSVVQLVFGSRLDQAVSKFSLDKSSEFSTKEVWSCGLLTSVGISIIPLLLSIYFSNGISLVLFDTSLYRYAVEIFSLNLIFAITEGYGFLYLRLTDKKKTYLSINLLKLAVQLALNIILVVVYDFGVNGVAISSAFSYFLTSLITIYLAKKDFKKFNFNLLITKKLIIYSIPLWGTAFFGLYTGSIHQPLINFFNGTDSLGVFNLAGTLGTILVVIFWQPFLAFWQVERFKYSDNENSSKIYQIVFYSTLYISIIISSGLGLLAYPVIDIMSSNADFLPAYEAVYPLAMSSVLTYLTYYMNFPFLLKEKTREIFIINIYSAITLTILLVIAAATTNFVGIAYALMINNFLTFIYTGLKSRKVFDLGVSVYQSSVLILVTIMLYFIGASFVKNTATNFLNVVDRVSILMTLCFIISLLFMLFLSKINVININMLIKQANNVINSYRK